MVRLAGAVPRSECDIQVAAGAQGHWPASELRAVKDTVALSCWEDAEAGERGESRAQGAQNFRDEPVWLGKNGQKEK